MLPKHKTILETKELWVVLEHSWSEKDLVGTDDKLNDALYRE
jgi:hypothetical protein